MSAKNIIVTGGAGYIGSHACKALVENGYTPISIDNLSTGWEDAVKFGPFEKGCLLDKSFLDYVFRKHSPFAVMHFAAMSQVGESVEFPERYWESNIMGSINLLNTSVEYGCNNFILSSTCATYGDQDGIALTEETPQYPVNAYGASKLAVEHMLQNFSCTYNINYAIFRYFNVAGADPSAIIGEQHVPETHLIPILLDTAAGLRDVFEMYGADYPTLDGTCIRDFVHVCDIVDAHILALKYMENDKCEEAFNLGTGNGYSIKQIIESVQKITKNQIHARVSRRRPGDCAKLVSGSTKAQEILGWKPMRSEIDGIITDAWRWQNTKGYTK